MRTRKPLLTAIFVPILIGCIGISNLARHPRFALFHTVDILQLIASGMCFGVALAVFLVLLRRPSAEQRQVRLNEREL